MASQFFKPDNNTRGNYWTLTVFKSNIEEHPTWLLDWKMKHIRFTVSPCHNRDRVSQYDIDKHPNYFKQEDLFKLKQYHYHVIIHADSNSTFKTIKDHFTEPYGFEAPEPCVSPYGMYCYFTHKFDIDKYQYSVNDIKHYNGSRPEDYLFEPDKYDEMRMKEELRYLLDGHPEIIFYEDFLDLVKNSFADPRYMYCAQTQHQFWYRIQSDKKEKYKMKLLEEQVKLLNSKPIFEKEKVDPVFSKPDEKPIVLLEENKKV